MRVLAIMGSHRKAKNTELALDTFLSELPANAEIEKVYLLDEDIKMCLACSYCEKEYAQCVIEDDMTALYDKFKAADVFVFASPVYFNGVTTLMKTMVDRIQMIFACDFAFKKSFISKDGQKKKAYLISLGGARLYDNQFIGSELTMNLVFKNLNADFCEHIKISETDRYPLIDRQETLDQLKAFAKSISKS